LSDFYTFREVLETCADGEFDCAVDVMDIFLAFILKIRGYVNKIRSNGGEIMFTKRMKRHGRFVLRFAVCVLGEVAAMGMALTNQAPCIRH